jgi:hypothetical protein
MFKQITACILLAALSLQTLKRVVVYIDYYTGTALYAKNCENKGRPMMHCNGKCQMMKKLREQEKKDSEMPGRRSTDDETISSKSFFTSIHYFSPAAKTVYNFFIAYRLINMPRSVFHPPGAKAFSSLYVL